jgi:hypothetical protein
MVNILLQVFGSISLVLFIYIIIHEKKTPRSQHLIFLSFGKKFPRVSYKDLEQATGSFSKSNLIGRGNCGSVYKGKLTQAKLEVAIKVFDLETRFADKSFVSECEALRTIWHRNLVPVLTACSTIDNSGNDFKSLIYEFMPNAYPNLLGTKGYVVVDAQWKFGYMVASKTWWCSSKIFKVSSKNKNMC